MSEDFITIRIIRHREYAETKQTFPAWQWTIASSIFEELKTELKSGYAQDNTQDAILELLLQRQSDLKILEVVELERVELREIPPRENSRPEIF